MSTPKLSERDIQLLTLVAAGHYQGEACKLVGLGPANTGRTFGRLRRKLGARTDAHAVHLAHAAGLLGGAA